MLTKIGWAFILIAVSGTAWAQVVDTGQQTCYDNTGAIPCPQPGEAFYGQDAQFRGNQPSYTDNGDGTVTDLITGLMWQQSPDMDGNGIINYSDKMYYDAALANASSFNLAGYSDWRLPTIKELYSLIMFNGAEPNPNATSPGSAVPFIDTNYFDFGYGDLSAGERIIDAQYASSTVYVSTTMMGNRTMFGVNFADGRIKGYPADQTIGKEYYVLYVRSNTTYGTNEYVDNGNGTITDNATKLMWQQGDSEIALNWEEALAWVQQKNAENYLGFNDWRLPNVKELQSIVDYTRAPSTTHSAAIDPLFSCSTITDEGGSDNYPFYWSSTTHANMRGGGSAAYVCFGEALGWMEIPPNSGSYQLMDVHGAGAQRSDPKSGDPGNYPYGHGPQGDVIRIYNYVRLVRDGGTTGIDDGPSDASGIPNQFKLHENYPNPFNPETTIGYDVAEAGAVRLSIYGLTGQFVRTLVDTQHPASTYSVKWDGTDDAGKGVASGVYLCQMETGSFVETHRMMLLK